MKLSNNLSAVAAFMAVHSVKHVLVQSRSAEEDIYEARRAIEHLIQTNKKLSPKFVRLGFHDCVGGCDGCVDLTNPDNNGLDVAIDALEDIVDEYTSSGFLSRADIWALAALTGAEVAQPNDKNKIAFPLDWIGRKDCEDDKKCKHCDGGACDCSHGDFGKCDAKNGPCGRVFPSPNLPTHGVLEFFETTFGFDAEETVAVLGAHTLGVANPLNSGFEGLQGWVPQENVLNNNYYVQLAGQQSLDTAEEEVFYAPNWKQIFIDNSRVDGIPDRHQWVKGGKGGGGGQGEGLGGGGGGGSGNDIFMLNADIALVRDFEIEVDLETGKVDCEFKSEPTTRCPFAEKTIDFARVYRDDNKQWVSDFQEVFSKMLVTGYDTGKCDLPPCYLH